MRNKVIAVLDDETDILELIDINLKKNGFSSVIFEFTEEFWLFLEKEIPDLIILDLMLNDADGFEICKKIKSDNRLSGTPIIMLSARSEEYDKVVGLELGADDYVTKPFSPRELIARVKAVLKRSTKVAEKAEIIKLTDDLLIDINKFEVRIKNRVIDFTPTEFKILTTLAEKIGWVFSREKLLESLWGDEKTVIERTIDVHIKNIREKLGKHADIIKGVRGMGYKIDVE